MSTLDVSIAARMERTGQENVTRLMIERVRRMKRDQRVTVWLRVPVVGGEKLEGHKARVRDDGFLVFTDDDMLAGRLVSPTVSSYEVWAIESIEIPGWVVS